MTILLTRTDIRFRESQPRTLSYSERNYISIVKVFGDDIHGELGAPEFDVQIIVCSFLGSVECCRSATQGPITLACRHGFAGVLLILHSKEYRSLPFFENNGKYHLRPFRRFTFMSINGTVFENTRTSIIRSILFVFVKWPCSKMYC